MIDLQFNKYRFYNDGYNASFISPEIRTICYDIINNTTWVNDKPTFADWSLIPNDETDEAFYEELIRGRMSYGQAPTSVKNLANTIIDMPFFDSYKQILVKNQHQKYKGLRNIKPVSMALWNKQLDVKFHNDVTDTSDFFVLIYLNDYDTWDKSWGGQLEIAKENEEEALELIYTHYPIDSSFVVINNMNPLIKHQVVSAGDKTRYTFGFRYVIE